MEDKKYDKIWRNAANLTAAYEDLRQMTALFAQARDAEKFIVDTDKMRGDIESKIMALRATEEGLHLRCKDEAEQIKSQKKQSKFELEAMKQKYINRYESEYDKLVIAAKDKLESLDLRSKELSNTVDSKTGVVSKLDKRINLQEIQIKTLETQFKKIGQALTQED